MKNFAKKLLLRIAEQGYQARLVSTQRLQDLQEGIEEHYRQGMFDEEFHQERLSSFDFQIPDSLPEATSIIVVAVPRPQSQVIFKWNGESHTLILPPTYVAYDGTRNMVEDIVKGILEPKGYHIAPARLPLKLLAVRSGLGSYGRNNICYVPGMGSFLQLVAVYSDLPCEKDDWGEMRMMKSCQNCHACRMRCPTGAIHSERFLLRAERCIVFHNEKPGDIPFPSWIDPSWHNCLVGCLHCQKVCPENKDFLEWIEEREDFSEKETALIFRGVAVDQLPASTVRKLKKLDLFEYQNSLPRNLGVFLKNNSQ
jgi:epoxyqueuosine reductase